MQSFLNLMGRILNEGVTKDDRTGISSKFISGATLEYNLRNGLPIITSRKVALRIAFEETMMFLRGITDTTVLEDKKIFIWKGNTSREFLDAARLSYLPVGSLGKGYSHQWRNFGGELGSNDGVDQVRGMLEQMKTNPSSRRHVITAWNPKQLHETPLPPCHLMHMYTIDATNQQLNSGFVMRSSDVPYGLPYNLMSYALLNHIFAKYLGLSPGKLVYFGWDVHIYLNQIDMCQEQLLRTPKELPQLVIHKDINSFEDMLSLEFSDIELIGYDPHPDIKNKPAMAL